MEDKIILVVGGTGSFGQAFVKRALTMNPEKIIVFSRDEAKQHAMRLELNDDRVQFEIGDVRDRDRVFEIMRWVDVVFHAAALKQVPSCEFFPLEAVKTNVLGTNNVLEAAEEWNIDKVVCLSTDKSVYPINAMGISKAMMEKIATSKKGVTPVCVTRYGNVMCSRGSVIPTWVEAAKAGKDITLTNGAMTRFLLTIEDAVDLVFYALENGSQGEIFIKKAPACDMATLAMAVKELYKSKSKIVETGARHGEKKHESLIGEEEMARVIETDNFYCIEPDSRDLNYSKFFDGSPKETKEAYTSENTTRLDLNQVIDLLKEVL